MNGTEDFIKFCWGRREIGFDELKKGLFQQETTDMQLMETLLEMASDGGVECRIDEMRRLLLIDDVPHGYVGNSRGGMEEALSSLVQAVGKLQD